MRVIVGAIGLLSLAVTVAMAQPPAQRAAMLKPPQLLSPDELPPIARGSGDDLPLPSTLSSTPVARPTPPPRYTGSSSPAWMSGVDPNVLPAGGTSPKYGAVSPLTPPSTEPVTDDRTTTQKIIDRLRGTTTNTEKQAAPRPQTRQFAQRPTTESPTAETPFRGTGANGAPVFAGPPAYRWYGWGSVTPGANPLAPAGQYPKASANWYSLTGATPGAFPIPVSNPARIVPGTEPPTYGVARTVPAPQSMIPVTPSMQTIPTPQPRPDLPQPPIRTDPPKPSPTVGSKFMPAPTLAAGSTPSVSTPVSVPTITPPPIPSIPKPVMDMPSVPSVPPVNPELHVKEPAPLPALPTPQPAPLPALPTPQPEVAATPGATVPPAPLPIPPLPAIAAPKPLPAIEPPPMNVPAIAAPKALPAVETPKTVPAVEPSKIALPTTEPKPTVDPKPLPTSVTTDPPPVEQRWQPATKPATPPPGTWAPAEGVTPLPTQPVPPPSVEQTGSVRAQPVVARGQMGDKTPDPIVTLIRQLCQGRADGIEIRWTGTKKLQVCFEVRTAAEAQRLVADISRRPELGPYQIDFCVLVK